MLLPISPIHVQNYIALFIAASLAIVVLLVGSYVQSGKLKPQADAKVEGQAGFVRGILRALARDRRIRQISSDDAFELISRSDGGLTLIDLAINSRIEPNGYCI